MSTIIPATTLEKFTSFGDLLRFLRRRAGITQTELSIAVGYSTSQISRLEQNLRLPDIPTLEARFVEALDLQDDPKAVARLLDLAANVRREDAPSPGLCPYKGLNYFDETDADFFIGRERLTAKLTERVLALTGSGAQPKSRFLAIVGASGSGKSSLLRAGLLPALRWSKAAANWHIRVLTPTAHPLESLAGSLTREGDSLAATAMLMDDLAADPRSLHLFASRSSPSAHGANGPHLLLLIDQFEELFALCRSMEERSAFIGNLLTAASKSDGSTVVVIALRADFYAACADYPELREALAQHQEYIGGMNTEELRRAIEEPARRGHWEFEEGLVQLLLQDVGHEPGALPLLSHALLETWERRRGTVMSFSGYEACGGVRGAIAETAEAVFSDQFDPRQQAIARRIFLRLTELGDESAGGETRRRATFDELILKPDETVPTQTVLKALADARLIITSENSAEVAHEALIREWPTLRGWLEDDREGLRLHRNLTEAAREWQAQERIADLLFRGARLTQAREWAAANPDDLNALEQEFLQASGAASEWEAAEREAQRQRELEAAQKLAETERRANGRLRNRALYLAGALVLALVMAFSALFFGERAQQSAAAAQAADHQSVASASTAEAEAQGLATQQAISQADLTHADALRLAAEANRLLLGANNDANLTTLLALRSMQIEYSPQGEAALSGATTLPFPLRFFSGDTGELLVAAYSPDGKYILAGYDDAIARLWDVQTGVLVRQFTGHTAKILDVAFSPDGREVATCSIDSTARLWDVQTGRMLKVLPHPAPALYVAFTPDGKDLITTAWDPTARLWDIQTGTVMRTFLASTTIRAMTLSPDGKQLLAAGKDGVVHLWDIQTGTKVRQFQFDFAIGSAAFSPDGQRILLAGWDGPVRMLDPHSGQIIRTFAGNTFQSNCVAFSPDGRYVLAGGVDNRARLWDAETGAQIRLLTGHESSGQGIAGAGFAPDGKTFFTGGGRIIQIWSLEDVVYTGLPALVHANDTVYSAVFSPDGRYSAVSYAGQHTAILWDLQSRQQIRTFLGHNDYVRTLAFSPDGKRLVTGGGNADNTVRVWDVATGKELQRFTPRNDTRGESVAFSPDGRYIAGFSVAGHLWDAASGEMLREFAGHSDEVYSVVFSPDSRYVLSGSLDGTAKLWDVQTGQQVLVLNHPKGDLVIGVAFSPDGKQILTGGSDHLLRLWDAATGKELREFAGHTDWVMSVAFSPDGKYVLSGSSDSTARLWDVSTGAEVRRFVGHTGGVEVVSFSPDGKYVLTGADDGIARVWFTDYHDEIQYLCSHLPRDFSDEERAQYGITGTSPTCPAH